MIRSLCVAAWRCLSSWAGAAARAPESATALRFQSWELPAGATVTQEVLKKGKAATLRYRIELAEVEAGGELRLRFEGVEYLELEGQDMTAPDAAPWLGVWRRSSTRPCPPSGSRPRASTWGWWTGRRTSSARSRA